MAETTVATNQNKIQSGVAGLKGFFGEVRVEMQKCTWPTKPELREQTIVVVVSCLLLSAAIWVSDTVLMGIMSIIF